MSETTDQDFDDLLQIDIVSDVVCPWCIVGFKQLEQALQVTGTSAAVKWHPFELNPQMAEEGENLREHLAAKYGTTPEQSVKARENLSTLGIHLGFQFNFSDDMRMANTFRAHQMIHWAGPQGKEHQLKMALFEAHFQRRENVNDLHILADIATRVGLDRDQALKVLEDERFAQNVRDEQSFWTSQGIKGVPAVIFDRRHLITGAQGVDNYAAILRQLSGNAAA
ncbi:putative DsbA family dithiol-disulfide isomerase [Roseibium hamelinense]|uniref:Putative DsbA family dithiol-disulfide isomerase n=1 Tax=Roseibium hamelinense TaxID=150831 RepID=A0A562SXG5_9HYPH|nr:DsbA family oxidoreductase [Roseibium hamelinense]MTI44873.1 DsbA family oxidoreductase [Roseibium hamelinense]TWI85932.1 putative DsbA family dithiol-disulfide isomerase [Roseibium hamelinense]